MSRIFIVLAIVSVSLLVVAGGIGLFVGDYNPLYKTLIGAEQTLRRERPSNDAAGVVEMEQEIERIYQQLQLPCSRARFHMLVGILASLVAVLVNSISVTYFIGTSRWCKEVVDTYGLDSQLVSESTKLKRRSFPFSLIGILIILMIVAFGAASDPGTLRDSTDRWVLPHFIAALGGGSFVALSFYVQSQLIRRNSEIVEAILGEVREVRLQRGLDVEG